MNVGDLVSVRKRVAATLYGNIMGVVISIMEQSAPDAVNDDFDWYDITILTSEGVLRCIPQTLLEVVKND